MNATSLYRRILGSDFADLPPVLRAFHEAPRGATATGVLRVRRGSNRLAGTVARALRLPPEGDDVPVLLRVIPRDDHEVWERTFSTWRLRTRQSLRDGRLREDYGVTALTFDVTADHGGMHFRSTDITWLGVRPPRALAVKVEAHVRGFESHWELAVLVHMPLLGLITSYEGRLVPRPQ